MEEDILHLFAGFVDNSVFSEIRAVRASLAETKLQHFVLLHIETHLRKRTVDLTDQSIVNCQRICAMSQSKLCVYLYVLLMEKTES